jgi:hypothetical protein
MKRMHCRLPFVLLSCGLLFWPGGNSLRAGDPAPDPSELTTAFLRWYLPEAFAQGSLVVEDPRIDQVIAPEIVKEWRKENAMDGGLGYVPFVGQDYADSWATSFLVGSAKITGDRAIVPVTYADPAWTNRFSMVWVLRDGRWWLTEEMLDQEHETTLF